MRNLSFSQIKQYMTDYTYVSRESWKMHDGNRAICTPFGGYTLNAAGKLVERDPIHVFDCVECDGGLPPRFDMAITKPYQDPNGYNDTKVTYCSYQLTVDDLAAKDWYVMVS